MVYCYKIKNNANVDIYGANKVAKDLKIQRNAVLDVARFGTSNHIGQKKIDLVLSRIKEIDITERSCNGFNA